MRLKKIIGDAWKELKIHRLTCKREGRVAIDLSLMLLACPPILRFFVVLLDKAKVGHIIDWIG